MKKLLILISIISIVFFACKKEDDKNNIITPVVPVKKTYKVTYEIGCTDCQVIYYGDSLETQVVEDHRTSTWTYTFYGRKNQSALLFAYNTSGAPQGVTATIKLND